MKNSIRFSIALIGALWLAACMDFNKNKEENLSEASDFNLIEINKEYSLRIPKYMKKAKDLNDDASLQYQNVFKETYVIVIDESEQGIINTFSDAGEYDSTLTMAENYRDIQLKSLSESITVQSKTDPVATKINGLNAQLVQVDGTVEGVKSGISYFLAFIEGNGNVYMIMAWTLKDRKDKYRKTFDRIAKSFQLMPGTEAAEGQ